MVCKEQHYVTIKEYRDKYKLVVMPGYNPDKSKSAAVTSYDSKLENNMSRARQTIFELGYCNDWQWFVTVTLDKEKYDRYNLPAWHKSLTQWLRDYKKRKTGQKIDFLLVPEQHEDGAWHIHGLMNGLPVEFLKRFQLGDKMGKKIAEKVKRGEEVYNWLDYAKKYGYCDLEPIKNHEAISKYITKYITKDMARMNTELGAHLYYCSRGLKRAEQFCAGFVYTGNPGFTPDYEGKYCAVKWFDDVGAALRVYSCDDTIREFDPDDFEELEEER